MDLLLVTGAGASRRLGEDDDPLPLMPDWSDALCTALDGSEAGLAAACHLRPGLDGEAFEEALGLLLRWRQVRPLEERFAGLGGPHPGHVYGEQTKARSQTGARLDRIIDAVNTTLYAQFGQHRVRDERATEAYGALLHELGVAGLVVATTNYDRAAEAALAGLGREVTTGFSGAHGRTPVLDVAGMIANTRSTVTPLLHLHGAVGWYEREGVVYDHNADQPFNTTLGTPVVLYPDPDKDPTNDAIVSAIWTEFEAALEDADHVLVLGHSLHDPALVRALRRGQPRKLAVTFFADRERSRISRVLPDAIAVKMDFGPGMDVDRAAIAAFRG